MVLHSEYMMTAAHSAINAQQLLSAPNGNAELAHDLMRPCGTRIVAEYMNSREAAAYLHMKHRTLLQYARRGVLPGIPLGFGRERNTWLFMKSAIDEALRAKMNSNRLCSIQENKYVN